MKMKNLLLFLLALIVVAPAWGTDVKPLSLAGVVIALNNLTENDDVSKLVTKLKGDPVYKAAACGPAKIIEGTTKIYCTKNDSKLMTFLSENAPATIQWSISCAAAGGKCTTNCVWMPCPSISKCCNIYTHLPCP